MLSDYYSSGKYEQYRKIEKFYFTNSNTFRKCRNNHSESGVLLMHTLRALCRKIEIHGKTTNHTKVITYMYAVLESMSDIVIALSEQFVNCFLEVTSK